MNYYKVTSKHPLIKPAYVYADTELEAKKKGFAEIIGRRGAIETVDLHSTLDNMIDKAELQD